MLMVMKYGNNGTSKKIPATYDQSTELIMYKPNQGSTAEYPVARGRWTKDGFLLRYGSLIVSTDKNEQYVRDIKKQLFDNNLLEYNEGLKDYSLREDIYLQSASTAGRLVLGDTCNGFVDWKSMEGTMLGHIVWPDDPQYF